MKELLEILSRTEALGPEETAVLATVVDVHGSSYRLPGAKMLIVPDGETFGTISGGCLEADVLERSREVVRTGRPEVFLYDTTGDEPSVFSLSMGCKGIVRILLERTNRESDYLAFFGRCAEKREKGTVATVISSQDDSPPVGSRWYFDEQGDPVFGRRTERFPAGLAADMTRYSVAAFPRAVTCDEPDNSIEFFLEFPGPPPALCIFGAGTDAIPLAEFALELGWRVIVVDHREAYANRGRFRPPAEIVLCRPEEAEKMVTLDAFTAGVVMTHNFGHDREYMKLLLRSDVFYIGPLGPRERTEELLDSLAEEGVEDARDRRPRLFGPAGLDIGGDTPETIALAILSEIQSVISGRSAGFLRDRAGSIYDRSR